eukprot:jgi/Astpho2/3956/Aster-01132
MPTKVVAVLPKGGDAANREGFVNCVEQALGLPEFLKQKNAELVVTADKDGPHCELEKHIPDMDILITTPFHPAYMTKDRIERAKKLQLALTAGVGSDHIDLHAAGQKGITVVECTESNTESVAEDEVMRMLILIRNFIPGWKQIVEGGWDVCAVTKDAWDMQDKTVGTVGAGHIGRAVMDRLAGWKVKRLYHSRHQHTELEKLGVQHTPDWDTFLKSCDVITINMPLTDKTRGMFNKEVFAKMKDRSYLVNNARGAIVDTDDLVEALKSGKLQGYGGDVWPKQPSPPDHPWRKMPRHAMTPHVSGDTVDAQLRIEQMTKDILQRYFKAQPLPEKDIIVSGGRLAEAYS